MLEPGVYGLEEECGLSEDEFSFVNLYFYAGVYLGTWCSSRVLLESKV